jgi:2-hydroxychromene-2-carboxylate isomerase
MTDGKALPAVGVAVFDFGSPNARHCHHVTPAIEPRAGDRIACLPILFGGLFKLANNGSPGEAFVNKANRLADTAAG